MKLTDDEIMREHEIKDGFADTVDAAIDAAMATEEKQDESQKVLKFAGGH